MYKSKQKVVQEISDGKAIAILVVADKAGRDNGDRMGKWLRDSGRKPTAEALLTQLRTTGVQRIERTYASA